MSVQASRRLGRYEVISRLGAGGMGEVFEAEDTTLGRRVAIKVLPALSLDAGSVERFAIEARAVARLSHPNILTIHDFSMADGTPFAVMELLEGRTLRALLDDGGLALHTAVEYATQLARGLAAAHAKGIAHRDIKPENIFITHDGLVKVLDFGIAAMSVATARSAPSAGGTSRATVPLDIESPARGTVGYLAPEQARGLPADTRADVFSFGAVLYEMVTGAPVFAAGTVIDTLHAVLYREIPPLGQVRAGVPPALARTVQRCLARDAASRYQSTADLVADLQDVQRSMVASPPARQARRSWTPGLAASAVGMLVLLAAVFGFGANRRPTLGIRDAVLIADVVNMTRDPVFDGTLKQGLEVQLAQSPFLTLVPPSDVASALALMGRRRDEAMTADVARELCLRNGIKAFITGSITPMGQSYVIGLQAIAAADGAVIAREQVQADRKEDVLRHLGAATTSLRRTLGESLPSIRRFDAPIEQATTSSLEALRAYAAGAEQANRGRYRDALDSYQRATALDEHFALAYQGVAREQFNTNDGPLFESAATKAYALRDRTTESENLRISSFYHLAVTRNLTKAIEISERWRQTYPDRWEAHHSLSDLFYSVGRFDQAAAAARDAIRLNPRVAPSYSNLAGSLVHQNRFAEARAVYEQAAQRGLDAPEFHFFRFWIASWLNESSGQQAEIAWFDGSAQPQLGMTFRSQAAGFAGHWRESRGLTMRAIEIADQGGQRAAGTRLASEDAPTAAALQDCVTARSLAARAVTSSWPIERAHAALALAMCREASRAEAIIERLAAEGPEDTILQSVWVPTVRAATALAANQPARALRDLERTGLYDRLTIWPAWLRGQALLRMDAGAKAVAEFQTLRDNRGPYDWAFPLYPLSHLWLARAAVRADDLSLARHEYDAFFSLWKSADADLPLLIEARQEYGRLSR